MHRSAASFPESSTVLSGSLLPIGDDAFISFGVLPRLASARGARMPSTPDEVFADTRNAALRLRADLRMSVGSGKRHATIPRQEYPEDALR